ncbi:MAG: ABC-type branched-chain amino acid transport system, periplasmic component [Acidimicrobiales bacterium]|nr:ABC-type branched-chain amino acid transport system, periplasmic component [Acidimicrobiales bacterium]
MSSEIREHVRYIPGASKGTKSVKTRGIALFCVLALVAAGCGSRLSDDELSSGAGSGGGATATTAGGTGSNGAGITQGTGAGKGKAVDMIGTIPVPCGKATGALKAPPAGTIGVTKDTIKLAVISDKSGQIKVPTASIEESAQAFVDWCNGFGGINGRKLSLTKIDSKLFQHLEATKEACNDQVFAIVGSGSVTDNQGAQAMVDCNLIEVPAYTATAAKALSDRMVQPVPNPSNHFNIGPALYLKEKYPKAIKKAAILWGDIDTAKIQADRVKAAYEAQGFKFVYEKATQVIQESYAAEAKAMKDKGIEYVTFVNTTQEAVKLLKDMNTQGFDPQVKDFGAQYYDPELLGAGAAAEGSLVQLNTVPFEEEKQSPGLQAYLAAYAKVGSKIKPTSLGVQSFSAGLLFATAAKAAGDNITRDNVLAELKKIKEWDGGGLHLPGDPGDNLVGHCFMYMVVKDGKFVRLEPKKPTEFTCDAKRFDYDLKNDYGGGAKAKAK